MLLMFYLFAIIVVISSLLVVTSKNSVFSVLWLILAFCNSAGLMILLGAEFLGMILIIVYVGAIAILFLFIVMMLNINDLIKSLGSVLVGNKIIAGIMSLFLFADLAMIIFFSIKSMPLNIEGKFMIAGNITNIKAISKILYTDFILAFQTAGIILFVAMISTISLTLRTNGDIKRQNIGKQLARNKNNGLLVMKQVGTEGIENINYDE